MGNCIGEKYSDHKEADLSTKVPVLFPLQSNLLIGENQSGITGMR